METYKERNLYKNSKKIRKVQNITFCKYRAKHENYSFIFMQVFYKPWVKAKIEYESLGKLLFPNLDELIRIHSKFHVVNFWYNMHVYAVVQDRGNVVRSICCIFNPVVLILESLVQAMMDKKKNGYVNEIGDVLLNRVSIFIVKLID